MNDSIELSKQEVEEVRPDLIEELSQFLRENPGQEREKKKLGRPQQVEWTQIVLGVLISVLFGMSNYQQLWRRLRRKDLGGYERIQVQDDAIIKRLKNAGSEPFERVLQQLGNRAAVEGTATHLAPFAPEIAAIDEMSGDQMRKQLKEQRGLKKGDKRLLPGKLAGRFNIRKQQWEVVQWREDAQANCKVNVLSLIEGLVQGSLLLFDLGYFAFWWLDALGERGYWWVSRLREKTSYRIEHVFWRFEGNIDALIWLGAHRADRAGRLVRMVRYWDGEQLHTYISNVLDPRQLSIKEIAQLYGRRWDIELAFLLIKEYFGLHHWWSSQGVLIKQQCLAVVIVSQLIQGLRMQMAVQQGRDAFEVSLPLVVELLPELLQEREDPLEWMRRYGQELGVIRASSRLEPRVPQVVEGEIVMPVGELYQERKARYHSYGQGEEGSQEERTESKTGTAKKRKKKKEEEERKKKEGKSVRGEQEEGQKEKRGERRKRGKEKRVSAQGTSKESNERKQEEEKGKGYVHPKKEKEGRKQGETGEGRGVDPGEKKKEEGNPRRKRGKERDASPLVREGLPEFSG